MLVLATGTGIAVMLGALMVPLFGRAIVWEEVAIYALLGIGSLLFLLVAVTRISLDEA